MLSMGRRQMKRIEALSFLAGAACAVDLSGSIGAEERAFRRRDPGEDASHVASDWSAVFGDFATAWRDEAPDSVKQK